MEKDDFVALIVLLGINTLILSIVLLFMSKKCIKPYDEEERENLI